MAYVCINECPVVNIDGCDTIVDPDYIDVYTRVGEMLNNRMAYTDAQIYNASKSAVFEVQGYCGRRVDDDELINATVQIAVIRLNRLGSEGFNSQSYSGVSESYDNNYPEYIKAVLNRKRKARVL